MVRQYNNRLPYGGSEAERWGGRDTETEERERERERERESERKGEGRKKKGKERKLGGVRGGGGDR
jgi:hypothetical protein